jgi:hypothetical protein
MAAPDVAWATGKALASSNAPTFDWPTSPAPAAGDLAILTVQSKTGVPSSPSMPGFTKILGPTNNPNGNATTTVFVKTCTGSESGSVTGSGFLTGQQDVVVLALSDASLDVTAIALVQGTGTADTSHAVAIVTTSGPDRLLVSVIAGRYSANTTLTSSGLNPPGTWDDQYELNVGVSGTTNETIGVATKTQAVAGSNTAENWGSSSHGLFSNSATLAAYLAFTVWAGQADGASASSGSLDTAVRRNIAATGASSSSGSLAATVTAAHDLSGAAVSVSGGAIGIVWLNNAAAAGASLSTGTLAATLQRGWAAVMLGRSQSNGDLAMLLLGDRPTDVPPQRAVGETGHVNDHDLIRVALAWLIGKIPTELPDDTTEVRWG